MTIAELCNRFESEIRDDLKGQGIRPKVVVVSRDGLLCHFDLVGADEKIEGMRRVVLTTILAMRACDLFDWAVFLGEAWVSTRDRDDPMPNLRASEDPNRTEGVFLYGYASDGSAYKFWRIKREGPEVTLIQEKQFDSIESWIDQAFIPMGTVPPHVKEHARVALDRLFERKRV